MRMMKQIMNTDKVKALAEADQQQKKWSQNKILKIIWTFISIPISVQISTPTPTKSTPNGDVTTASTKSSTSTTSTTTPNSQTPTTTIVITPPDTTGMSSGSVAIVVIVCLMAAAGGAVFLVMYFKRESRLRKLLASIGQETRPDQNLSSFDNVGYESSSSKQMPPSSSSDAWIKYIVWAYARKRVSIEKIFVDMKIQKLI